MYKVITIGKLTLGFGLRHKFERKVRDWYDSYTNNSGTYELGVFFSRHKIAGRKTKDKKKFGENMVSSFDVGLNAIVFKVWIDFDYNGLHLPDFPEEDLNLDKDDPEFRVIQQTVHVQKSLQDYFGEK